MKHFAVLLLLVGFVGMAVFGLFVMDFSMRYDGSGCVASRLNGNDNVCPMNLFQMAFHHVSAFQVFSLSTAVFSIAIILLFLLTFFASFLFFIKILSFHPPQSLRRWRKRQIAPSLFQKHRMTRWLALFEHSPSFI